MNKINRIDPLRAPLPKRSKSVGENFVIFRQIRKSVTFVARYPVKMTPYMESTFV
jgi:hypothetical protein